GFYLANATFFAWFGLVLIMFSRMPAPRAVFFAFVFGELFLPEVRLDIVWDFMSPAPQAIRIGPLFALTKANVIALSVVLGTLCFDSRRVWSFRPRWFDIPMVAWCLAPLVSDYLIGEGLNNLYGQTRDHAIVWFLPYFLGRIYLTDLIQFLEAARVMLLGA